MTFQGRKSDNESSTTPPDGGKRPLLTFVLLSIGAAIVIVWVLFLIWLMLRLAGFL
jgi:hypothetical protein